MLRPAHVRLVLLGVLAPLAATSHVLATTSMALAMVLIPALALPISPGVITTNAVRLTVGDSIIMEQAMGLTLAPVRLDLLGTQ